MRRKWFVLLPLLICMMMLIISGPAVVPVAAVASTHFTSPNLTDKASFFMGSFKIFGAEAQPGDEVAFFDPQGKIAGVHVVTQAGQYGSVAIYGDDASTTSVDEGAVSGDVLTVKIWDASSGQELQGTALALTAGVPIGSYLSSSVPPVWQDNIGYVLNIDTATHFPRPVSTPYVSNFMGSVTINGAPAEQGDEVAVFDPDGVQVGHFTVATAGSYGIMPVYGDDPSTSSVDEGAVAGDLLSFKIWGKSAGVEYSGGNVSYAAGTPVEGSSFLASALPPKWASDTGYALDLKVTTHPSTLTITADAGQGGVIEPRGKVTTNYGANASFSITPSIGYHIADVRIDGITSAGSVTSYTFYNVVSNHTISALFSINTYTITVLSGVNGSIDPPGPFVSTEHGANAIFTVTPGTGYRVADVIVDLVSVGSVTSYTFTNVVADHTIEASFVSYTPPEFTLVFPVQDSVINTDRVEYTLNKTMTSGSVTYTRTGGASDASHTYSLKSADLSAGSHALNTGLPLVNDAIYSVAFTVNDGVNAVSAIVNNVTYDPVSMLITNTRPSKKSTVSNATVGYTFSEKAKSGRVTFTRTGGAADAASHIHELTGALLDKGSHTVDTLFPLVDGAFYTVSFEAVDVAGNPATTVLNALVFFDSGFGTRPAGKIVNDGSNVAGDADVAKLKSAEGSRPGDPDWNPAADLDRNNVIDQKDLMIMMQHYGR